MSDLKKYIVLYRDESIMTVTDAPFAFRCHAEDPEHAEEQCLNAEPDADIVWVVEGDDYEQALDNYWSV